MLTVIIIAYKSDELVKKRIKEIGSKISILVIENSRNKTFKEEIERIYPNAKVIIPETNLGFGAGSNLGFKLSKTDYVFLTQPDLELIDNCIDKLIDCIKSFQDFTVITPMDIANKDHINYEIHFKKKKISNNPFDLIEVDYVDLSWLINMKNFNQNDYWDEKIFLYFEALDFARRLRKNKRKIFISKKINTFHLGSKSHQEKYNYYANLNKNWHYNWSKFYYLKKHYGYLFALRSLLFFAIKTSIKYFYSLLTSGNSEKTKFLYAELSGMISSILNKPSSYRPYKDVIHS